MRLNSYNLKSENTFGIDASCNALHAFTESEQLCTWLKQHELPVSELLVLGGGSNMLLCGHIDKTLIKPNFNQITYQDNDEHILVSAGAGVNWHQLVMEALDKGYSGLENLSLIPGNVGAAPIQNIGAYGVELQERFIELEAISLTTGEKRTFSKQDCQFAYRDSVFKNSLKGQYLISSVTLKLDKTPSLVLGYGPIKALQEDKPLAQISAKEVSDAVIAIRQSKLPDPEELGNAGSFFKNPVIDEQTYLSVKERFPNLVAYPQDGNRYKLAAGWLIDQAGLKGFRHHGAGVHSEQALVLVNHGEATYKSLLELAAKVRNTVWEKFKVELEPEVWIIGQQDIFEPLGSDTKSAEANDQPA